MRGRWQLPACVAAVLLAHAGLMAAWLRASASGIPHAPPHEVARLRLIVAGPVTEPRPAQPQPVRPGEEGARAAAIPAPEAAVDPVPAALPQPGAVAARSAQAPERVASTAPSSRVATVAPIRDFLSPAQVDRAAISFPSPDVSTLSGLNWSGIPIRLRLFIDASGQCVDVQVLRASDDAATLERMRQMFLATHFLPAQRAGVAVAAYRDIEVDVSDVK